jgi:thiamine-monophosphate kinase
MSRPGEDELIARYFAPLAADPGAAGLHDDAATASLAPGEEFVLTKDVLVAGVHFFADDPADLVARKALRVNLSDLAAKGATPGHYLLGLALPDDWDDAWLAAFAAGLAEDQPRFGVGLLGGDTTRAAGPLVLSVTALGVVPAGRAVRRSGARPGDVVAVSGAIGDAALGLALRQGRASADAIGGEAADHLRRRYLLPEPRVDLAPAVRACASAAMDVSDGLVGDLAKLCGASGVGARIELERVPLSEAAARAVAADPALFDLAMTGGDDYEILACFPEPAWPIEGFTALGRVTAEPGVRATLDGQPRRFERASFQHF